MNNDKIFGYDRTELQKKLSNKMISDMEKLESKQEAMESAKKLSAEFYKKKLEETIEAEKAEKRETSEAKARVEFDKFFAPKLQAEKQRWLINNPTMDEADFEAVALPHLESLYLQEYRTDLAAQRYEAYVRKAHSEGRIF